MIFCSACGQGNDDGASFCTGCGAQLAASGAETAAPQYAPAQPPLGAPTPPPILIPPPPTDGSAIASLILSIASYLVCPVVPAVLGIVLGYVSLRNIDGSGGRLGGRDLARAGIILGWVHIALVIIVGVVFLVLLLVIWQQ